MKVKPTKKRGSVVLEVGDRDEALLTSAAGGEAPFRIKDILVPIDFSECSKKALRYAIPLAKAHGAKLTLLNVVPSPTAMGQTSAVDFTAITSPLRTGAQKQLAALTADEVRGEVLTK